MVSKLVLFLVTMKGMLMPCPDAFKDQGQQKYHVHKTGKLPSSVREASGLVISGNEFWINPDSGQPSWIWKVPYPLRENIPPEPLIISENWVNNDWESLATDHNGHLYIGDFGNNNNDRSDLGVIKYNLKEERSELISFRYPDQEAFPPRRRKDKVYNCEAMFWWNNALYLLSKKRAGKYVRLYHLPSEAGHYVATVIDTLVTRLQVTGADVSPDGRLLAILGYGKVLIYAISESSNGHPDLHPVTCRNLKFRGQTEAIAWLDNRSLIILNEQRKIYWMYREDGF
jgi:hypothetical protein